LHGKKSGNEDKESWWNLEREEEVKEKKIVAGSTSKGKIANEFRRKRTRNVRYMWDQRK
jgi:hypothetical protein